MKEGWGGGRKREAGKERRGERISKQRRVSVQEKVRRSRGEMMEKRKYEVTERYQIGANQIMRGIYLQKLSAQSNFIQL
jgi:hypothetical protein